MPLLDDLDHALLTRLRRDGRASISSLSTALHVARGTVQARLTRMERDGVITGFTVLVAPEIEEQSVRAVALIQLSGASARVVSTALKDLTGVRSLHSTNGKWDLVAELHCANLAELDRVLAVVRSIRGIANTETSILLSTL